MLDFWALRGFMSAGLKNVEMPVRSVVVATPFDQGDRHVHERILSWHWGFMATNTSRFASRMAES